MEFVIFSRDAMRMLLLGFIFVLGADAGHILRLSEEEDLALERQIQAINKPAIRSFKTSYGATIDCVNIYKQLAFDHPLLKNHTIQMKPEHVPEGDMRKTRRMASLYLGGQRCPKGTVPIVRATKEDLLMAKYIPRHPGSHMETEYSPNSDDIPGQHSAMFEFRRPTRGAKASISNWNPAVSSEQFSLAKISVVAASGADLNNVQAGWMSYDSLYPDSTRLFIYWTDTNKGDWWLGVNGEQVGYWPRSLFTSLVPNANAVAWGGQVFSPFKRPTPAMGSGHPPSEGLGKAASMTHLRASLPFSSTMFVDPENYDSFFVDAPECYDATSDKNHENGRYVLYGGPAGLSIARSSTEAEYKAAAATAAKLRGYKLYYVNWVSLFQPRDAMRTLLVGFIFVLGADAGHRLRLSEEEDLALERQLRVINKPTIRSFKLFSLAEISVVAASGADLNNVQTGWMSYDSLYPDSTRLFIYWTDTNEGDWWLGVNGEQVGYWPRSLFTSLLPNADAVAWGGQVFSPLQHAHPGDGERTSPLGRTLEGGLHDSPSSLVTI
ncbi:uncharacterized protein LOC116203371 [Punica granatum]|uniref:Uncharacterized protein LOC116203371 n=1 Tax=Punica granatum TaxID=22663 RepID=A0A6P8D1F6_PUNGR|nr:uncharacterized protein LOC116203371 [Punica granatum]